jgi:hypothetical protein
MATVDLTPEDFRILQYVEQRGGIASNRPEPRYRRLAEAGYLEHQAASMDTEWFGITDKGRDVLAKWV